MFNTLQAPGCSRFGMTDSYVPFEPNANADGTANPLAGKDDAILYGATKPAPGGLPLGTLEYLSFSRFFNTPGTPFDGTLNLKAGGGALAAGTAALTLPAGWTADAASKPVGAIADGTSNTVTFSVTPPRGRRSGRDVQDRRALHDRAARRATRMTPCASSPPPRAATSASASGPSTTTGSPTRRPRRCASAARPRWRRS